MARPTTIIALTPDEKQELHRRLQSRSCSKHDGHRADTILRRSRGIKQTDAAKELGVSIPCENKSSQRFERAGLEELAEKSGGGRKPSIFIETVAHVITKAGKRNQRLTCGQYVLIVFRGMLRHWKRQR